MVGFSLTRRAAMAGMAALPAGAAWPLRAAVRPVYLSARADRSGNFYATGLMPPGDVLFDVRLPARGHSMAVRPDAAEAVFFARRPGRFAMVIDLARGRSARLVDAAPGRWLNGHGVFSADGARLFVTETVADTGDGVIGIYDPADGYRRIGEWLSGGLDPHDVRLLADGRTLVVAHGGILRDAATPRAKLNIDTMTPSLDCFDARRAVSLARFTVPPTLHQLSIRHLSVGRGGRVAVAMQYEGPAGDRVPLVAIHEPGAPALRLIGPPSGIVRRLRQYCGSAAVDARGRILGVTSPRGGVAAFWNIEARQFLGLHALADCCGIAPGEAAGSFLISNGYGTVQRFDAGTMSARDRGHAALPDCRWDNHMMAARRPA